MFTKRLFHKALHHDHHHHQAGGGAPPAAPGDVPQMDAQIALHYGVPYTASLLAFDPVQRLLAVGTLDGRIKIFGGDNIEGILISPKSVPYKFLQFIINQGLLVAISNENEIQVWNLEFRQLFYSSQWDVNITAFAAIEGSFLMYLGDENGLLSVLKYEVDDGKLQRMPYNVPIQSLAERAGISLQDPQPIVGILIQPDTFGTRVLIAYEKGLLVLWDVSDNNAVSVRGYGDLHVKGQITGARSDADEDQSNDAIDDSEEEREICSLCWASRGGSIVAVGYITGDILLWDMNTGPPRQVKQMDVSSNVVKLQLASGSRRLPVIVLHWSAGSSIHCNKGGHLFVYGGDDMGSEEVLTILSLESTAGLESVRCMSRMDLKLDGSFADMILIPDTGVLDKSRTSALFILTNPGQLNFYADGSLFSVQNTKEGNALPEARKSPVAIPTIDPNITVTNLCSLTGRELSNISLKKFCARQNAGPFILGNMKWPLTGGVPSEMSLNEDHAVERLYIAGYQDGSVRIWDATFPVLMPMFVLDGKVADINLNGANASVSSLAFCSLNMTLAVGTTSGLVRIYKLREHTGGSSFHFVSELKQEVHVVRHGKGFHCYVAFLASNCPVRSLLFTVSGEVLATGYQNGQVAMFDPSQLSILFTVDCASGTNSPVVCLGIYSVMTSDAKADESEKESPQKARLPRDCLLSLTKDGRVTVLDCTTGVMMNSHILDQKQSSAISMYVIDGASDEKQTQLSEDTVGSLGQTGKEGNDVHNKQAPGVGKHLKNASHLSQNGGSDSLLICCEDVLLLLSLASLIQGKNKHLHKLKLAKPCCWSAVLKNMDGKIFGLILAYQTGTIELRSVPDLAIIAESSLMSILRWSYKAGMDKSMSSSNGQITLVSGSEFAIISLMASENDFRIPESLPCLHDKVLAAAAEAAISFSTEQRRKQNPAAGILGGIIKGMKGKAEESAKMRESFTVQTPGEYLESFFLKDSFVEPPIPNLDDPIEELSIDDIEIDDEVPSPAPASSSTSHRNNRTTEEEREKLFEGSSHVGEPRMRTPQEILTKYKFGGDAAAAAAHAKDKLMQRQEKLEELAKTMENKKWWKL
ncbi:hypothetical protein PVAP13_2KG241200 [Panicum virgatum]|uniref:Transducin family protein / WD-40 repeat family protein n=2 Tax=Panicum virgatum TaxID=38727 RepID=A0A8T0WST8_PANVG|nr:hypothetical protein PVAP13_2KG241200 [Panicum virgatum]